MAFFLSTHHHLPLSLYSDKNVISSSLNCNQKSRRPITIISAKPKKVDCIVKLALQAGKATLEKRVGKCLGGKAGFVIPAEVFMLEYKVPVQIFFSPDKSFTFILKSPTTSSMLLKAAGVEKGSRDPMMKQVGKVTIDQVRKIAQQKLPDMNCTNIDSAMRMIAGTAANMGIDVEPPILEPKQKEPKQDDDL